MHLIQQHSFDIQCSSHDFGKEIQSQLNLLLEKEFYPKLELLLNKYDAKNTVLSVAVLNVEISNVSKKYWKEELVEKSLSRIEDYLQRNRLSDLDENESVKSKSISNSNHAVQLLIGFLKTGKIPENAIAKEVEKLVYEVEVSAIFINELLFHFDKNRKYLIRWIFSVPEFFKEMVVKKVAGFPNRSEDAKVVIDTVNANPVLKKQWLELVQWSCFLENKGGTKDPDLKDFIQLSDEYFEFKPKDLRLFSELILEKNDGIFDNKEFFEKIARNTNDGIVENKVDLTTNKSKKEKVLDTILYINNAGLVLFHPFLKSLFEQLNLCEADGAWTSKSSQHKAVLLSQYLVISNENIQESDLVLNKILCGLSIDEVVNVQLEIILEEKEICNRLLDAVREHWKALSTSSIEGLQEAFVQRNAKLDLVGESTMVLWVESKGVDILLESLPWSISLIQTPWMENYLSCHWSY